jgi:hypothetical protein
MKTIEHPVKSILPVTFREGDRHAQPGEQPLNDREWAEGRGNPSCLGRHLARQIASILQVDPSGGFEEIEVEEPSGEFPGWIAILPTEEALEQVSRQLSGQVFWSGRRGSRLASDGRAMADQRGSIGKRSRGV